MADGERLPGAWTARRSPTCPPEFVAEVSARYVELYEALTGQAFVPDLSPDPEARIRHALADIVGQE